LPLPVDAQMAAFHQVAASLALAGRLSRTAQYCPHTLDQHTLRERLADEVVRADPQPDHLVGLVQGGCTPITGVGDAIALATLGREK